MRRPPAYVALVARTHWLVGGVVLVSSALITWMTRKFPIQFGAHTYEIVFALAALYLLAGTFVWFGAPFGRVLSRICGLLYLARPRLGSFLWEIMDSAEYKAHFDPAQKG